MDGLTYAILTSFVGQGVSLRTPLAARLVDPAVVTSSVYVCA